MDELTREDLAAAAEQLGRSTRGRKTMRALLDWLNDSGLGLDEWNKIAVLTLLNGAFGAFPMAARDAMHDVLESAESTK